MRNQLDMVMKLQRKTIVLPSISGTSTDKVVQPESERAELPCGTVLARSLKQDSDQKYYLYIPCTGGGAARTFVAVHGITRNAAEQAHLFSPFAERYGVVLIAPLFPADRFRDYQRLGREGKGERADFALDKIVTEVQTLISPRTRKLYLYGYSGGGQFVHRYAMAHPERVARIALAAAGWYTFPDPTVNFPLGIRQATNLPDVRFNLARFLSVPTCLLVGEKDVVRDPELRKSDRIDRQQGITRLERGKRWIKVMAAAARAYNLDTPHKFQVLPNSNHSFAECMERGDMGRRVFEFLFADDSESNY
jgi:pimeloyl-ACP methyl ester carboxylesterase